MHQGNFALKRKELSIRTMKKALNGAQEKVVAILSPLTRMWNMMEEERNLILADNKT